jgi:hypothetical protein
MAPQTLLDALGCSDIGMPGMEFAILHRCILRIPASALEIQMVASLGPENTVNFSNPHVEKPGMSLIRVIAITCKSWYACGMVFINTFLYVLF